MGDIIGGLFGKEGKSKSKSTSTSESGNYAYPQISAAFGPAMQSTSAGTNWLGQILGIPGYGTSVNPTPSPVPSSPSSGVPAGGGGTIVGGNGSIFDGGEQPGIQPGMPRLLQRLLGRDDGGGGNPLGGNPLVGQNFQTNPTGSAPGPVPVTGASPQQSAMSQYADSAGMKFLLDQGINQINSNMAGKGLLQSGATASGLEKLRQGLATTYLNQYLDKVLDFSRIGLGAGGLVTSAGAYSKGTSTSTSKSNQGKSGLIPDLLVAYASAGSGDDGGG